MSTQSHMLDFAVEKIVTKELFNKSFYRDLFVNEIYADLFRSMASNRMKAPAYRRVREVGLVGNLCLSMSTPLVRNVP